MIAWAMRWIVWFTIRAVVTLACVWTVQNLIVREGYRAEFDTLLFSAIVTIIAVRMWMPSCKQDKDHAGS
jgi:hypothetical protein